MLSPWQHWALAFTFTQAVEIPIYRRMLRVSIPKAFGASALTHPVVWFLMPSLADWLFAKMASRGMAIVHQEVFRTAAFALLAEGFAVLAEALYFRALKAPRPLLASLAANGASALLGYLCWRLTGFP
ncbi:MAG: hypothetical protein U0359_30945 [Byssovorax sp.]